MQSRVPHRIHVQPGFLCLRRGGVRRGSGVLREQMRGHQQRREQLRRLRKRRGAEPLLQLLVDSAQQRKVRCGLWPIDVHALYGDRDRVAVCGSARELRAVARRLLLRVAGVVEHVVVRRARGHDGGGLDVVMAMVVCLDRTGRNVARGGGSWFSHEDVGGRR